MRIYTRLAVLFTACIYTDHNSAYIYIVQKLGASTTANRADEAAKDCAISSWSQWSGCSVTCGQGKDKRTRSVVSEDADCGSQLKLKQYKACDTGACREWLISLRSSLLWLSHLHRRVPTAFRCTVSAWGAWSACSASCGKHKPLLVHVLISGPQQS